MECPGLAARAWPEVGGAPSGIYVEQVHARLRVDSVALVELVRTILQLEGRAARFLGIVLTDMTTVREMNRTYRGGDYDTDVLSFPLGGAQELDGEVYVSLDYAQAHHTEFGSSFEGEVRRYVVHGLLHLMGYDDADSAGRAAMRALEDRYLAL